MSEPIKRAGPTGKALAEAFAAALKPGQYGTPIIEKWNDDVPKQTSFVVRSDRPDLDPNVYLVTVEEFSGINQSSNPLPGS